MKRFSTNPEEVISGKRPKLSEILAAIEKRWQDKNLHVFDSHIVVSDRNEEIASYNPCVSLIEVDGLICVYRWCLMSNSKALRIFVGDDQYSLASCKHPLTTDIIYGAPKDISELRSAAENLRNTRAHYESTNAFFRSLLSQEK
jgi:hypothetical protein